MIDHRDSGPTFLARVLERKRLLICCGAGGVGKTTTSAALGIAAAQAGRRALVLTIDPARRLCEAMGLADAGGAAPHPLSPAALARIGATSGRVGIWMLDATAILDSLVRQCAPDGATLRSVMDNRLYRVLREVSLGVQEFAAAEAVFRLIEDPDHDLIVLDTPPSRNALDFLDAPQKLAWLFNKRLIGFFLPSSKRGFLRGKIDDLVATVFGRAFGEGFLADLREFLGAVSSVFETVRDNAERVRAFFRGDNAAALMITSPDPAARAEAQLLRARAAEMQLPCAGYVLNRSWAYTRGLRDPRAITLPDDAPAAARRSLERLAALAEQHRAWAARDRALLAELRQQTGGGFAIATPHCGGAVESLEGLALLARHLLAPGESEAETRARLRHQP